MTDREGLDILSSDMAANDMLLDYRSYSTDELIAERTTLRASRTTFISQNMGSKGFTKNLQLLEDRIRAVAYVLRERGSLEPVKPVINNNIGVADFGGIV